MSDENILVHIMLVIQINIIIGYVHTRALSSSSWAFTFPHCVRQGHAFWRMPQPVLTCASVDVQLVTSVDGDFDGGI
jgi:hypothetical protein